MQASIGVGGYCCKRDLHNQASNIDLRSFCDSPTNTDLNYSEGTAPRRVLQQIRLPRTALAGVSPRRDTDGGNSFIAARSRKAIRSISCVSSLRSRPHQIADTLRNRMFGRARRARLLEEPSMRFGNFAVVTGRQVRPDKLAELTHGL
jgi:hypothetical protein